MLIVSISGVYAEDIDVESSVVTESPISADVDTSLSSCNAFNDDLSNIYEPSDSSNSYGSFDSYGYFGSSDVPQINEKIGYTLLNSYGYYESYNGKVIDVEYNNIDSFESVDVPVVDVDYSFGGTLGFCEFVDGTVTDIDVDYVDVNYGALKMPMIDVYDEEGELNQAIKIVDDNVIINNYNSFSRNILENIPVSTKENLNQRASVDINVVDTIISEVTDDMGTSESYKLIRDVTQADNLLKFENVDAILAIDVSSVPMASEPVFDGILRASEYISNVEEVYFGTLSQEDNEILLKSIGSENTLLFAGIANWYSDVTFEKLQNLANHGQICEDILDGCTVTKALLQYYPLTNELYIYKLSSDEDEHNHVINDTNSHGLDYAYGKHVDVIYKDMPNLMVLTSYGVVFIEKQLSAGSWDSLNDVLGARISSETLLPDHKAIWTPLLLLKQQDLQKSVLDSHADDNGKFKKINATNKMDNDNTNGSNSSNKSHNGKVYQCYNEWLNWGHSGHCCHYASANVAASSSSVQLDNINMNSTGNSTKNSKKNSTNNSTNVTNGGMKKSIGSPKTNVEEAEPTYTLIYAIIGIAIVCYLFNSSYMRRDD